MQYLLIQNQGEAPVEGYTVLGYSSTRHCNVSGVIGQFGSGTKHAINLCLRNGVDVWVYCGKTRLDFSLEEETVSDGLTKSCVYHVVYQKGNNAPKRAGWVLDFGALDWDTTGMALREFISNAIDRTLREDGSLNNAVDENRLTIKIVDSKRAKAGFTRVYVGVNDEVREYFGNLGKRFLHFSDNPELAYPCLIEKDVPGPAQIYREGVWVRELASDSIFDYNFDVDEIRIDECRNSSEYSIKVACAEKMKKATSMELSMAIRATIEGKDVLEASLDEDYLTAFNNLTNEQRAKWLSAWEYTVGSGAIACDSAFSREYVENKGYSGTVVKSNWMLALRNAGVTTALDVLNVDEQRGLSKIKATEDAKKAVEWAWELFEMVNLTSDRKYPEVFCFQKITIAGENLKGFQNEEGVHIHIDIANEGQNNELRKTALEEVAHWITGATDNSRDFQNFFIDTLISLAS